MDPRTFQLDQGYYDILGGLAPGAEDGQQAAPPQGGGGGGPDEWLAQNLDDESEYNGPTPGQAQQQAQQAIAQQGGQAAIDARNAQQQQAYQQEIAQMRQQEAAGAQAPQGQPVAGQGGEMQQLIALMTQMMQHQQGQQQQFQQAQQQAFQQQQAPYIPPETPMTFADVQYLLAQQQAAFQADIQAQQQGWEQQQAEARQHQQAAAMASSRDRAMQKYGQQAYTTAIAALSDPKNAGAVNLEWIAQQQDPAEAAYQLGRLFSGAAAQEQAAQMAAQAAPQGPQGPKGLNTLAPAGGARGPGQAPAPANLADYRAMSPRKLASMPREASNASYLAALQGV